MIARADLFRRHGPVYRAPCAGRCDPVPPQVWHKDGVPHGQPDGTGTAVRTSCAPDLSRIALRNNRPDTRDDGHVTCRFNKRTGVG